MARCAQVRPPQFLRGVDVQGLPACTDQRGYVPVCLDAFQSAVMTCVATTGVAIFRTQTPGMDDESRLWFWLLIRFAYQSWGGLGDLRRSTLPRCQAWFRMDFEAR